MYETKSQENQNQEFEIKRGMVFFFDATEYIKSEYIPTKVRAYLVLSNDMCNKSSAMIHVAPIITRSYENAVKRWYTIPFKGADDRDCIVNIADIMLVPKTACNAANYSERISARTMYNRNLFELIGRAIARQFDIGTNVIRPETEALMRDYPVNNAPIPVSPVINLNISINGVPVQATAKQSDESTISVTAEPEITEVKAETVVAVEKEPEKKVSKVAKAIDTVEKEPDGSIKKFNLKAFQSMTPAQRESLMDYISKNYRGFGGTMSYMAIAKVFGVSEPTVMKYAKQLLSEDQDVRESCDDKRVKFDLPKHLYEVFLKDYKKYSAKFCLEKYKKYGFEKVSQIRHKARSIQRVMETRKKHSLASVKK